MSEIPEELLDDLPEQAREIFARLGKGPLWSVDRLRAAVVKHTEDTRKAAASNEFLDASLAEQIARRLQRLLKDYDDRPGHERAVIQAVVRYFVLKEDAENDLDSVLGFEDDAKVLNACLDHLSAPELEIPLE
jgi:uncharacterized membrane protein YkvA (DUF1232 family)